MANERNLKPIRSSEEAKRLGHRGGVASGIARCRKRDLRLGIKTTPKFDTCITKPGLDLRDFIL